MLALFLRTRGFERHFERLRAHLGAVEPVDGGIGFWQREHVDEAETFAFAFFVGDDTHVGHSAELKKAKKMDTDQVKTETEDEGREEKKQRNKWICAEDAVSPIDLEFPRCPLPFSLTQQCITQQAALNPFTQCKHLPA